MKFLRTKNFEYLYDSYSNSIIKVSNISEKDVEANRCELRESLVEKGAFNSKYSPSFNTISIDDLHQSLNSRLTHLVLNITNQCNFRCKYCAFSGVYPSRRKHNETIMSRDTAFSAVDFFLKRATDSERVTIGFYGGEPITNFDLVQKVVEKVKREYNHFIDKIHFSMTTNGWLLKDEIMTFLKENDFSLSISLDGPENIHDKWRINIDGKPTFDLIMQNLSKFKDKFPDYYGKKIIFEATVTPPFDLISINDFFLKNPITKGSDARYNYVNEVSRIEKIFGCESEIRKNNIIKSIQYLIKHFSICDFDNIKNLISIWLPIFKRIHFREKLSEYSLLNLNGICMPGVRKLFVNTEGMFHLCERLDYFESIGSVSKGFDLETIHKILENYTLTVKNYCGECWARYLCNLCFISIAGENGMDVNVKPNYCANLRQRVERGLQIYLRIMELNPNAFDEFYKNFEDEDMY